VRTVSFKSVFDAVIRRIGDDPDVTVQDNTGRVVAEYISERIREGWEAYYWPEWTAIEERTFRSAFDLGVSYAVDAEVYYPTTEQYYRAISASTGNLPSNSTFWELAGNDFDRYISLDQPGQTPIGEVLAVHTANPRISPSALELGFWLSDNGIQIDGEMSAVWVEFCLRPPEFTSQPYDPATTYAAGSVRYLASTGQCYRAREAVTAEAPNTSSKWEEMRLPYVLSRYATQAAYADVLTADGQHDNAGRVLSAANDYIAQEWDKIELKQRQQRRFSVRTR